MAPDRLVRDIDVIGQRSTLVVVSYTQVTKLPGCRELLSTTDLDVGWNDGSQGTVPAGQATRSLASTLGLMADLNG